MMVAKASLLFSDFLHHSANAVIDLHPCQRLIFGASFHLPVFFIEWYLSSAIPNSDEWFRIMMDTQVYAYKNGGACFTFWTLKNNAVKDPMCTSTNNQG